MKIVESVIREVPRRPISETFAYEHVVDLREFEHFGRDPRWIKDLKRHMAYALADHIVEKCQLFEMPTRTEIYQGLPIRMQVVINDRGSYENWLPQERKAGAKEGAERVIKSLPYGYEPNQYWE